MEAVQDYDEQVWLQRNLNVINFFWHSQSFLFMLDQYCFCREYDFHRGVLHKCEKPCSTYWSTFPPPDALWSGFRGCLWQDKADFSHTYYSSSS